MSSVLDNPRSCRWCGRLTGPEEANHFRRDWWCSDCGWQNTTFEKPKDRPQIR